MSHVMVRLGAERFALPMDAVAEVGRLPLLTRIPGAPDWVAGVANWRGRVLGVVDLRRLLGLAIPHAGADGSRLVILSRAGVDVGVVADRVDGVLTVDPDDLETPLATLTTDAHAVLAGQLTRPEGLIGVIDPDAVCALRHRIGAARRAG